MTRSVLAKLPRAVTLRDVLTHTSGLPFMSRVEPKIDCLGLRESVVAAALSPLKFAPGTRYDYNNAGINTAGRVLEVASAQKFADFVDARQCRQSRQRRTSAAASPASRRLHVLVGHRCALSGNLPGDPLRQENLEQ